MIDRFDRMWLDVGFPPVWIDRFGLVRFSLSTALRVTPLPGMVGMTSWTEQLPINPVAIDQTCYRHLDRWHANMTPSDRVNSIRPMT